MDCNLKPRQDTIPWQLECKECGFVSPFVSVPPEMYHRRCHAVPLQRTDILPILRYCLSCPYLHRHHRGARCTHKNCQCHGSEKSSSIEIGGEALSPQLVNMLTRAPSCPDGRW